MKIVHVYRTFFPDTQGGLEETIRQICAGTQKQGGENRVFTLSPNPLPAVLARPEATVHRFPLSFEIASCSISLRCLSGFRQLVEWADVVHYHFPWPLADLLHFGTRVSKPSLLTYHADIVRQKGWLFRCYQPVMFRFLDRVAAIAATSPNYAASSSILERYRHKLHIVPIGIDLTAPVLATDWHRQAILHRYGTGYFLFVGVLRYYKGLHLLLEASRNAPFTVVIAGHGPMERELKQQAAGYGLNNVHFTGYVDDATKAALFHHARGIVFPSHLRSEAFGVTLLEGASFAKPLITAEIGSGMSYINQHQQTGLIVPPDDPVALRDAMETLHRDAALARQLGEGARARVQRYFTAEQMASRYCVLYEQVRRSIRH